MIMKCKKLIGKKRMNKTLFSIGNLFALIMLQANVSAQTCHEEIKLTAPDERYSVGEGIVTDNKTGLIWSRCAVGQVFKPLGDEPCEGTPSLLNWKDALDESTRFEGGNRIDWRLPNLKELASLTEKACFEPAINENVFPATEGHYWTSSPDVRGSGPLAWIVDFKFGGDGKVGKQTLKAVRFVAGGDAF